MSYLFDVSIDVTRLYDRVAPLFRHPYHLTYAVTTHSLRHCSVLFALEKESRIVAHASVVYTQHEGVDPFLTAVCTHVDSEVGCRVGSFLFLLHFRLAMGWNVRLLALDNMTDDPLRAARGLYALLMFQEGRDGWEIQEDYRTHVQQLGEWEVPFCMTGPEMVGVPSCRDVIPLWNVCLRRLRDHILACQVPEHPWSGRVRDIFLSLFLSCHPMTLRSSGFLLSL